MVENQSECRIKVVRTDNGTKYTSEKFKKLYENVCINHQLFTP